MNLTERIIEQLKINEASNTRLGVAIIAPPYKVCGVTYALLRCDQQKELVGRLKRAEHEGLSVYPRSDGLHVCIASGKFVAPANPQPVELTDDQFARLICGG